MNTQQLLTPERSIERGSVLEGMPLTLEWVPRVETYSPAPLISAPDVRELIEAAGPLFLRDIAEGLDVPVADLEPVVAMMVAQGLLRQDEWTRYALAGAWRGW
jgi:hypothetical protein